MSHSDFDVVTGHSVPSPNVLPPTLAAKGATAPSLGGPLTNRLPQAADLPIRP